MLGIREEIRVMTRETLLRPGDFFLLYTDGLVENTRADGTYFSPRRLRRLLESSQFQTCDEVVSQIEETVKEFWNGHHGEDDYTLIAFTCSGGSSAS